MPGQVSSSKGNPASHRMSNAGLKARRQKSWQLSEIRKQNRRQKQKEQEQANRLLKAAGKPTAWQLAKAERLARRLAEGKREVWLKRQAELA